MRERLTFANVTAVTALFIALGGTSYAAITLPRNSVGANQIRSSAVRSSEIRDRSINARDLTLGARRFLKGQKGEQGERGPQGPAGSAGSAGSGGGGGGGTGALSVTDVQQGGTVTAAPPGGSRVNSATANCGAGRRVISGGVRVDTGPDASARESYPSFGNTAWTGVVGNDDDSASATFTVFAICVPTS